MPYPEVSQLIPHQPPMRLLDQVIDCTSSRLVATASLSEGCPFWTQQGVPACMGLEYLGQAAAAFFTVLATSVKNGPNTPPRPGMLVASRSYECVRSFFPAGCTLRLEVSPTSPMTPQGLVKFTGTVADLESAASFATGDFSVYLPPA